MKTPGPATSQQGPFPGLYAYNPPDMSRPQRPPASEIPDVVTSPMNLESESVRVNEELEALYAQQDSMSEELLALRRENEELTTRVNEGLAAAARLDAASRDRTAAENATRAAQQDLKLANAELAKMRKDAADLRESLRVSHAEIERLAEENGTLNATLLERSGFEGQPTIIRPLATEIGERAPEQEAVVKDLRFQITKLQGEVAAAAAAEKASRDRESAAIAGSRNDLRAARTELEALRQQVSSPVAAPAALLEKPRARGRGMMAAAGAGILLLGGSIGYLAASAPAPAPHGTTTEAVPSSAPVPTPPPTVQPPATPPEPPALPAPPVSPAPSSHAALPVAPPPPAPVARATPRPAAKSRSKGRPARRIEGTRRSEPKSPGAPKLIEEL